MINKEMAVERRERGLAREGLMGKVLSTQHEDLSSTPQSTCETWHSHTCLYPSARRQRQEDPWGLLASLAKLLSFRFYERICL